LSKNSANCIDRGIRNNVDLLSGIKLIEYWELAVGILKIVKGLLCFRYPEPALNLTTCKIGQSLSNTAVAMNKPSVEVTEAEEFLNML
jgi:hypothetical protein